MSTTAHDYARIHAERFLDELKTLIRIPSISTQPQHAGDVLRAAEWLAADMLRIGFDSAELITMPEGRHPLVLGEWSGAGANAPTVLIYCHYDVQPAEMADGWDSEPFEPLEKDGKLYARGAVDSKLHVIAQLRAIEALLATPEKSPVNLKVILEGEEESGSENINAFVAQHGERLRADVCVISDGAVIDLSQPSLITGLRGIVTMELRVYGPAQDLHSGHFGGNTHNPIHALCHIVAQLHDSSGRVQVPGFYDDVLPLSEEEREALADVLPWIEREWRAVANGPQPWGEPEYTLHERAGARPTLEVNGIRGGYAGDGFKTVLPSMALAKISCRLVERQEPIHIYELVRDQIARLTPSSVRSELHRLEDGAPATVFDLRAPAMQAASQAYELGWGVKPIYERAGGSVPIAHAMQKLSDQIVLMGFGHKGGKAHGPNENIYIEQLYKGIHTAIHFIEEIGRQNG